MAPIFDNEKVPPWISVGFNLLSKQSGIFKQLQDYNYQDQLDEDD